MILLVEFDAVLGDLHLLHPLGQRLVEHGRVVVPTRPPNSGISAVVPTGCGPRGLIEWMWTASTSPFSAPSTAIGPHCGLRKGTFSSAAGLSLSFLILPSKASCVSATTMSPGLILRTGSA